jgi:opacity protein-like surface antigen
MSTPLRALLLLPLLSGIAVAGEEDAGGLYWRIGAGGAYGDDADTAFGGQIQYDEGYALSGAIGWHVGELANERFGLAVELEAYRAEYDVKSDNLLALGSSTGETFATSAFFVNGVVDWRWNDKVALYVAGGVGATTGMSFDSFADGPLLSDFEIEEDSVMAVQGKAGLRYHLGGGLDWELGYRYISLEELTMTDSAVGSSFDLDSSIHTIEIGVSWGN